MDLVITTENHQEAEKRSETKEGKRIERGKKGGTGIGRKAGTGIGIMREAGTGIVRGAGIGTEIGREAKIGNVVIGMGRRKGTTIIETDIGIVVREGKEGEIEMMMIFTEAGTAIGKSLFGLGA